MSIRYWLTAAAIALAIAANALAQDSLQPSLKDDPVAERRQEEGALTGDEGRDQQPSSVDLVPVLSSIESAIRDLMSEEDQAQRRQQVEREKRDLAAQEEMATWAMWMFWATFLTVLLTFAALVAVIRTLHHTRRAADYARDMVDEAKSTTAAAVLAADHAREQVELAQLANEFAKAEAERQFDPYLFVAEATYGPMPDTWAGPVVEGQYWIAVTIKNDSSWPAFIKRTWIHEFVFWDGALVASGGNGGYGVTSALKPGDVRVVEMGGARGGDPPAVQTFIGVRFGYDSVDGRRRHKDFWLRKAHEYGPPGGWWLDRLDDAPCWFAELPEASKGPWGSVGNRVPTEEEREESSRYTERNIAKIREYLKSQDAKRSRPPGNDKSA
ncbi:hypothetical protein RHAB21_02495 [Pseudorhizobium halotolerans]|uniref:Uncharacterized protein n=1 Tax=Pseudorhizobium halotolerans TaxID=1233081 RepID=A0ABM8PLC6_9HYPH|nr:hypothetical protein [Pseudorhizobium halotolerans]CAD7036200.1 hypothetical protein RHAB21_02495 [Pseudorhizobium halotolerans]